MDIPASPEIASLITAFYAAFDNRGGRPPAVAELRALFAPEASITRVNADGADTWDPEAFIAPRAAMLRPQAASRPPERPKSKLTRPCSRTCAKKPQLSYRQP